MKFRKKPVVIEAVQMTQHTSIGWPSWVCDAWDKDELDFNGAEWIVRTLEDGSLGQAKHVGQIGDWLIQGVKGELYFCKPDIFEATYEPVPSAVDEHPDPLEDSKPNPVDEEWT